MKLRMLVIVGVMMYIGVNVCKDGFCVNEVIIVMFLRKLVRVKIVYDVNFKLICVML